MGGIDGMLVSQRSGAMRGWSGQRALLVLGLLIVGHALLATVLASAASPAPALEIIDVSVAPLAVGPGEPVTVETNVHNPSNQEAEFGIVLLVDEVPEEEQAVSLPARATRTLRFTVVRAEPGPHVVRVGPHAATFQVLSAQFVIRDLSVNPPAVAPGEPVTILATVENVGAAHGMFQVPLVIDGSVVDVRTDLLHAGQSTVVSFETIPKASGSYTVLVGDLAGAFTAVSPAFDVRILSSIRISHPTTTSTDEAGASLDIPQDVVTLSAASDAVEVTLPVALSPGDTLGSFRDSVSGIVYDGATLVIPLRDAVYREVARLVVTPGLIAGQGTHARLTADKLRLVVPDTPLNLPPSALSVEPVSFGMELPLKDLKLDTPLSLTPGLRPAPGILARVELQARAQARTVAEVVASATVEIPASLSREPGTVATVAFGVPSSWLESVNAEALEVARIEESGAVELSPISEMVPADGQTLLKAEVSDGRGIFVLLVLSAGAPPEISQVVLSESATIVGVPLEIRALVEAVEGEAVPANAVLWVNREPVAVEPVQSLEDGSRAALFYLTVRTPGEYALAGEETDAIVRAGVRDVLGHAQVFYFNISPQQAAPGESVEVAATVGNVGPRIVVSEVILLVNNVPTEKQLLAITAGDVADVRFDLTRQREGVYEVSLLNARGAFTLVTEPTPASFQVTDLKVEPATVDPGQPVTVTFTLKNTGELEGSYQIRVFLNRLEEERRELPVSGLTTLPLTFPLQPKGEGIFTVEVAGLRRTFVVVSPEQRSDLVLQTLSVDPPTVAGGEPVVVTVDIRNRATESAAGVLTALVNGEIVGQRELVVDGRGTTQETFFLSEETPGLYQVEVRQGLSADVVTSVLKGEFLVTRKQAPASWEIFRLEVTPQPARPHEALSVSFLLSNLGEQKGEVTVTVEVDGVREIEETLRVGPQTTQPVTFPLEGRPEGTYIVAVNGIEVQFHVVGTTEEPTPTEEPEETPVVGVTPSEVTAEEEEKEKPWMTAILVAVLAAVIGVVYGFFRWRRAGRSTG